MTRITVEQDCCIGRWIIECLWNLWKFSSSTGLGGGEGTINNGNMRVIPLNVGGNMRVIPGNMRVIPLNVGGNMRVIPGNMRVIPLNVGGNTRVIPLNVG